MNQFKQWLASLDWRDVFDPKEKESDIEEAYTRATKFAKYLSDYLTHCGYGKIVRITIKPAKVLDASVFAHIPSNAIQIDVCKTGAIRDSDLPEGTLDRLRAVAGSDHILTVVCMVGGGFRCYESYSRSPKSIFIYPHATQFTHRLVLATDYAELYLKLAILRRPVNVLGRGLAA